MDCQFLFVGHYDRWSPGVGHTISSYTIVIAAADGTQQTWHIQLSSGNKYIISIIKVCRMLNCTPQAAQANLLRLIHGGAASAEEFESRKNDLFYDDKRKK